MTGDLREAAQGVVRPAEIWAAQLREFAPDNAATHSMVMRSAAKFLDQLSEDARAALAAPPPEGPWEARGDGHGWWAENRDDGNTVSRRGWGSRSLTESQAHGVARVLNEDEAKT